MWSSSFESLRLNTTREALLFLGAARSLYTKSQVGLALARRRCGEVSQRLDEGRRPLGRDLRRSPRSETGVDDDSLIDDVTQSGHEGASGGVLPHLRGVWYGT